MAALSDNIALVNMQTLNRLVLRLLVSKKDAGVLSLQLAML